MILQLQHISMTDHKEVLLGTVDSDVILLAKANFFELDLKKIDFPLGLDRHNRYMTIHELANSLGRSQSAAMPIFHALTGCDVTSPFSRGGKQRAREIWNMYPA